MKFQQNEKKNNKEKRDVLFLILDLTSSFLLLSTHVAQHLTSFFFFFRP